METQNQSQKKPRVLCLHGFRSSADIFRADLSRWPEELLGKLDLVFIDAPFHAQGKPKGFYEWFHSGEDFQEFYHFEEGIAYIEDFMVKNGPFDGLMGFSQGAIICAASPGMQSDSSAFTKVPKIKFVIIMAGSKFGGCILATPKLAANAFSSPIKCPSLHTIGEKDSLLQAELELLDAFVEPSVIYHPEGHTIPRLDDREGLEDSVEIHRKD